ncbi:MAG: ATP-binding protein [Firmicutes bacterium]|nr:ATP-binding protein [Bacillota bacterium]
MFREKELQLLNKYYRSGKTECVLVYGHRRIGKTSLINEFATGKRVVYFAAAKANASDNLKILSKAIAEYGNQKLETVEEFSTFDAAFDAVTDLAKKNKSVFIIRNLEYLCDADETLPAKLKKYLANDWKDTRLVLILCESSVSFIKKEVLGSKCVLAKSITEKIKLEPLNYRESAEFHTDLSAEDNAFIYGITGGIPYYIEKLSARRRVKSSLITNLFDRNSYLYEEPGNLLRRELREPAEYNTVLTAMAEGCEKQGEIAAAAGMETSQCNKYLKVLMDMEIVEKVDPVIWKSKRSGRYRISDSLFRFWYTFVPRNISAVYSGRMENVYDDVVGPYVNDFVEPVFANMCRTWLWNHMEDLPFKLSEIGEWWRTDPDSKEDVSLDVLGIGPKVKKCRSYIIGSCSYGDEKVGADELESMKEKAKAFAFDDDICVYYIFSKSGFSRDLKEEENKGNVKLVTLEDLFF